MGARVWWETPFKGVQFFAAIERLLHMDRATDFLSPPGLGGWCLAKIGPSKGTPVGIGSLDRRKSAFDLWRMTPIGAGGPNVDCRVLTLLEFLLLDFRGTGGGGRGQL